MMWIELPTIELLSHVLKRARKNPTDDHPISTLYPTIQKTLSRKNVSYHAKFK
eukprot:jgi/Psemu1/62121/gm1.62121_g